jgi:8-oxo-dGTP pyrophosphatase MutT (NUDIX family)
MMGVMGGDDMAERLIAQALRFAESGQPPVTPRLAATVMLLRPAPVGFEVYLLRRAASMRFASGMYAFPGGTVDPSDYEGPGLEQDWSIRLGRSAAEAEAVVRAAVREVNEETGVCLAPADLVPWTRWITPEFEPRRYDTYFFCAALADGQDPADISGEADRTEWLRPAHALARMEAGEILMLPPTSVTLGELAGFESVLKVLAAAGDRDAANPVIPRVERDAAGTARFVI